jgi:hypothetical protein
VSLPIFIKVVRRQEVTKHLRLPLSVLMELLMTYIREGAIPEGAESRRHDLPRQPL